METAVVTGGAGLYGTAWGQPQPLNEELRGFAMSVALNAAACYLKLGAAAASCTHDGEAEFGDDGLASSDMCRWRCSAVCRCERVVRLDPTNVKARFRHAQALASGGRLVDARLALPAYDQCMKASHLFNLLDARGVISVTERASYIGRVRALAKACCQAWLESQTAVAR